MNQYDGIKDSDNRWGRAWNADTYKVATSLLILTTTPLMVFYFYISAFHFDCSLFLPIQQIVEGQLTLSEFLALLPPFSWGSALLFLGWVSFQIGLAILPDGIHRLFPTYKGGSILGSITPGGLRLSYNINGLQAWLISHLLFLLAAFWFGWFSPTIIFDHWGTLLWIVNGMGFSLAIFAYVKAYWFPSFPQDRKFSRSVVYDFFMGIELNPRVGPIDLKLFFNGRPGIVAWTLINISFASAQYAIHGTLTNSMLLVNLFQGLYVLYFFWKEAWYLNTIDIHHDHFGWMLAWGDCVWLPYMYTLQGLFLVFHPVDLSWQFATFVLSFGLLGFWIFASSNNQKDRVRKSDSQAVIWGRPPEMITCSYVTQDGTVRQNRLLASGWWGVARHMNYTGDLILSLCYSLACGFDYMFPYFYFLFLSVLLVHRCLRDEDRCRHKYGNYWREYCDRVPYRLIPKVW
jgi:7-dehydrocholesterol reductase